MTDQNILHHRDQMAKSVYWLLTLSVFLFADQNLLSPNLSSVASELHLSSSQKDTKLGGQISLFFFAAGIPATLIMGYLTDRVSRRHLLAACVLIGEIPVLFTLYVKKFPQLLFTRTLTGVSLGGSLPIMFSLFGDLVPSERRSIVSAQFSLSSQFGVVIGQFVAGFLVSLGFSWRIPFAVVAIPTILFTLVVFIWFKEPARGLQESDRIITNPLTGIQTLKQIFSIRTNLLCFLQGIPGCIPWGIIVAFLNDFLSQEHHLPLLQATVAVSSLFVGTMLGCLVGGLIGQYIYNRHKPGIAYLMGLSTVIGTFPTLVIINHPPHGAMLYMLSFVAGFLVAITGPNVRAVLMNVNRYDTRGSVFSIFAMTDDLGKGFGPFLASALIHWLGRQKAFNVAVWAWFLCGLILLPIALTINHDVQCVETSVEADDQTDELIIKTIPSE